MSDLKTQMHNDMTASMRARDELRTATLRMVLAAVQTEEVAGKQARTLSEAEVQAVVSREAKKRREAAEAFDAAGRKELADRERAEGEVIATYLPAQLSDDELAQLVRQAIADSGADQMGPAMKAANGAVAGRAEGGRVAAEVKKQLAN